VCRLPATWPSQKEQTLTVSVTPPTLTIVSDADSIEQVLRQLLDNAVKFTPPGGEIGLDASATDDGEAVRLTGMGHGPWH
jgi:signal transduction histidine kinase